MRGLCPRAPGIYRFGPEWHQRLEGDRKSPCLSSACPALGSHPCVALSSGQVPISIRPPTSSWKSICRETAGEV
jgi:hypothetical protein